MTQAAGDALALSQNILTQTGSTQKAIGPLQQLITQLQNSGDKSGYAQQEIIDLQKAIDQLKSKQIMITVEGQIIGSQQAVAIGSALANTGGNSSVSQAIAVLSRASGGPASGLTLVGEQGPELVDLPNGSYVNSAAKSMAMLSRAASSPSGLGGYGGGQVTFRVIGGDSDAQQFIASMIREHVVVYGGSDDQSVQRAFGAVT